MPSVQTVAPSTTAISLAEAKDHLRVDGQIDNDYITELINTATLTVEHYGRQALIQQTRRLDLYGFHDRIVLDMPPLASVSGITYTADGSTTSSTLSTDVYDVDATSHPGQVLRAANQTWPDVQAQRFNAVQVTYVTGYATASSAVPSNYRHAMKLLIDRWYSDRTDYITGTIQQALPWGVKDLIRPTRNFRFV